MNPIARFFKWFFAPRLTRPGSKPEAAESRPLWFANVLVDVARGEIGVREQRTNWSPEIQQYWSATSYPDGWKKEEPWCAAVLCWIFRTAAARIWSGTGPPFKLPRSARVVDWREWAKSASGWVLLPTDVELRPGDVVAWDFNGPKSGGTHIGLVETGGSGNNFVTLEGNTDGSGSRDGDGFYRRKRTRAGLIFVARYTAQHNA
jgi:hypothetical protein